MQSATLRLNVSKASSDPTGIFIMERIASRSTPEAIPNRACFHLE